ncbi:RidA family protein [soil metagenome]
MHKLVIRSPEAPSSPLYSQGIRVGNLIFVSGMTGVDVVSSTLGATIQSQTTQALSNCAAVLEAAGSSLDDVVQVTVLLADPTDFAAMNAAYSEVFSSVPPTRAVTALGVELPNVLVSIMMTAYVDD